MVNKMLGNFQNYQFIEETTLFYSIFAQLMQAESKWESKK